MAKPATATAPSPALQKPRKSRARRRELMSFLFFTSPWLFGFFIVTLVPLIWGFYLSLTNFSGMNYGRLSFIGAYNYLRALHDPDVWYGLWHTAIVTLIGVPVGLAGGLALAVMLNQKIRAQGVYRTLFYIPSIVPVVALVVIWQNVYNRNTGLLNALIDLVHKGTLVNWIADHSNLSLIVMGLWALGGGMIIYLAALQGVPTELREAAAIDGAGPWHSFRRITLPLITPVLFFQLVMGIIHSLQLLVPAMLLKSGGYYVPNAQIPPANRLYMVHLFQQTFNFQRFSYGLALAWIMFVIVFVFSILIVRSGQLWVHYEVEVEERGKG